MGKKLEKLKQGQATKYLSRNQAIKKLQISLKQFRKLCILKGIYPVEPLNNKIKKKSTKLATYYLKKDILMLQWEPLLKQFRIQDALARKGSFSKPLLKLDHVIKERYPKFEDALKDLDDSLSLIAMFSTLNSDVISDDAVTTDGNKIAECQRLMSEFLLYCTKTNALRKGFLSIKGIYYQVEIKGILITWISPYQFSMDVPFDVDFKVLNTFLDFNTCLLGFVNFKLFQDLGLSLGNDSESNQVLDTNGTVSKELQHKVDNFVSSNISKKDGITINSTVEEKQEVDVQDNDFDQETSYNSSLFRGHYFYVSREVPLYLVKFIIEACGGACGWDQTALGNSPIDEQDSRITVQITDRPSVSNTIAGREYLQPQWIYDCVNANKLVKTNGYHLGEKLPPHLSPFVVAGADDYVPGEVTVKVAADNINKAEPEQEQEPADQEEKNVDKDLAKIMMSKRERKLYDKMQYGLQKKKLVAAKLRQKAMQ